MVSFPFPQDKAALSADNTGRSGGFRLLDAKKLTVPQAARLMGIGQTKMRTIIQQGEMPVLRVGGKVMIIEQDIERYLQGNHGTFVPAPRQAGKPKSKLQPLPPDIADSPWIKGA
jgi:excisionase family DNA binding protein